MLGRRTLVIGSVAVGLSGAAGIVAYRREQERTRQMAAATADYLAGRVVVIDGWIVSASEAARLAPGRAGKPS